MRRTCSECGKPLGSTLGKCHGCGGRNVADPPGTQQMYDLARWWKVVGLGIPPNKVEAAHEESKERNPRYDEKVGEWK